MQSEKREFKLDKLSDSEISALIDQEFSVNKTELLMQKALDLEMLAETKLDLAITKQQLELTRKRTWLVQEDDTRTTEQLDLSALTQTLKLLTISVDDIRATEQLDLYGRVINPAENNTPEPQSPTAPAPRRSSIRVRLIP